MKFLRRLILPLKSQARIKNKVVGDVYTKNPKTGKPIQFKNVVFEKFEMDWNISEWARPVEGMWHETDSDYSDSDYKTEYWGLFGFIESLVKCKAPKDYDGFGSYECMTIYPLMNKLVKRGSISLPNPFTKK